MQPVTTKSDVVDNLIRAVVGSGPCRQQRIVQRDVGVIGAIEQDLFNLARLTGRPNIKFPAQYVTKSLQISTEGMP